MFRLFKTSSTSRGTSRSLDTLGTLHVLPDDILMLIFSFTEPRDTPNLTLVCKAFNAMESSIKKQHYANIIRNTSNSLITPDFATADTILKFFSSIFENKKNPIDTEKKQSQLIIGTFLLIKTLAYLNIKNILSFQIYSHQHTETVEHEEGEPIMHTVLDDMQYPIYENWGTEITNDSIKKCNELIQHAAKKLSNPSQAISIDSNQANDQLNFVLEIIAQLKNGIQYNEESFFSWSKRCTERLFSSKNKPTKIIEYKKLIFNCINLLDEQAKPFRDELAVKASPGKP